MKRKRSRCGAVKEARQCFDAFCWNSLIKEAQGQGEGALQLFRRMLEEAVMPNKITFLCFLSSGRCHVEGKRMHARIAGSELERDVVVGTALVNLYSKCGNLRDAIRAFMAMPDRNVISWTAMIGGYSHLLGHCKEALQFFQQMQQEGVLPNKVTFLNIIVACANTSDLVEGHRIHVGILGCTVESDVVIETALVHMYGKCHSLQDSRIVFEKMTERNVVTWNAMVAVCNNCGQLKEAIRLFEQMQLKGVLPDKVTFLSLLAACARMFSLAEGKLTHAFLLTIGYDQDVTVGNTLINMYGKCGSPEDAEAVFDKLANRDVVSWTAIVSACVDQGQNNEALCCFEQMQVEGFAPNKVTQVIILTACASQKALVKGKQLHVSILQSRVQQDLAVQNALVHMYGKCSSMEEAQRIFYQIRERDAVSWNAMIALHSEHGQPQESLQLFNKMQREGVVPDKITFVSALTACANLAAITTGEQMHRQIIEREIEFDITVTNALISMYGKCGNLEKAQSIFDNLHQRNVITWSAMIGVYALLGYGKEAIQLFDQMTQGRIIPNSVTFVNILVACSHAGLVCEGLECFECMEQVYGISPSMEHYASMIDLLGRAGQLDDVECLINSMPCQANTASFMALLRACRYEADVEQAKRAARCSLELDPERTLHHTLFYEPCMEQQERG